MGLKPLVLDCVGSTPGCGPSNSGSNPGILPNIVHKVKTPGTGTGPWGQKQLKKKKMQERSLLAPCKC